MAQQRIYLGVQENSPAERDRLTAELLAFLRERSEHFSVERARERPDTMDGGALLIAVLAAPAVIELAKGTAPAVVELAKGIADWMRKRNVTVTLSADGTDHLEGPPEQVERILRDIIGNKGSPQRP